MCDAQFSKTIDTIRGKNLVGKASQQDVDLLLQHIDALEDFLDEYEVEDIFGTEGWRHAIGIEDF
ncbi:MAG: hypothetical protein WA151_13915 [Desulfatirhabdiaceae bacterium]